MKSLFRTLAAALLLSLATLPAARAADLEWPATEPGRRAREYFPAYNGGEEAMRAYFAAHVSADDLKIRPLDARIDVWKEIRGNNGDLTPLRVVASGDDFTEVLARNEAGDRLRIRFLCHASPPYMLRGLRIEDDEGGPEETAKASEPAGPPPTDAQIVAALSAQLDSLARAGKFSGVALLEKSGKELYAHATGLASRAAQRPNRMDTRFNLGSINKIFTTVAIHQLEQAGKLKIEDPIARYLPDYPAEAAKKITIRMLLEHRGGVPDMLQSPELREHPEKVRTASDWYALVRERPLNFEPGTKQQYSNGGYAMLGMIVERVSGESYYAYVRKHIYEPAGMKNTDSWAPEERKGDFATAYSRRAERGPWTAGASTAEPQEAPHLFRGSAAGGGYSTAGDLLRFARALREGKLLDAQRSAALGGSPEGGLGIAGGSPGVNAYLQLEGPYTFVVLANADPPAAEQFARTTGRMLRRATGRGDKVERQVRAGGGAH